MGHRATFFLKTFQKIALSYNISFEIVHKKINLIEHHYTWEHERFSIKKIPAFTLSSLNSFKAPTRNTVFKDNFDDLLIETYKVAKVLSESLFHVVFKNSINGEIFGEENELSVELVEAYMDIRSALHNNDLKHAFEKYLNSVKTFVETPDVRDPDFMFYDDKEATIRLYRVKPAIFDLFVSIVITIYVTVVYYIIKLFPKMYIAFREVAKYIGKL